MIKPSVSSLRSGSIIRGVPGWCLWKSTLRIVGMPPHPITKWQRMLSTSASNQSTRCGRKHISCSAQITRYRFGSSQSVDGKTDLSESKKVMPSSVGLETLESLPEPLENMSGSTCWCFTGISLAWILSRLASALNCLVMVSFCMPISAVRPISASEWSTGTTSLGRSRISSWISWIVAEGRPEPISVSFWSTCIVTEGTPKPISVSCCISSVIARLSSSRAALVILSVPSLAVWLMPKSKSLWRRSGLSIARCIETGPYTTCQAIGLSQMIESQATHAFCVQDLNKFHNSGRSMTFLRDSQPKQYEGIQSPWRLTTKECINHFFRNATCHIANSRK